MLNRKNLTLIVLILIALISVRFFPGCGEGLNLLTNVSSDRSGSSGVDWMAWSYRREVTISNSGSVQNDYQVNVVIENEPAFYTKAAANGDDIRFNYNGTSIPYWIELWDSGGTRKFSVWVKVPVVSNPDTVIYLYYGNSGQSSESDFDNTFTKDSGFSGLVARWHIDEGSGSSLDDSSANNNNGAITGAVWAGSDGGKWYNRSDAGFSTGDSLSFDGSGDYAVIADDASLDVSNITIAAWIKTGSDVTTSQFILAKWVDTSDDRSYAIGIDAGLFYFYTAYDTDPLHVDSLGLGSVSTNTDYHFAATSDGINKRIYINGTELAPAGSWLRSIRTGTSQVRIGMRNTGTTSYFSGIIDEVSIYNTALSANQIKALSQRSKYSSTVSVPVVGAEELVP